MRQSQGKIKLWYHPEEQGVGAHGKRGCHNALQTAAQSGGREQAKYYGTWKRVLFSYFKSLLNTITNISMQRKLEATSKDQ